MNSTVTHAIALVAGGAIGSVATWYFVKKKYETIAQEEIDSVKERFLDNKSEEPSIYISPEEEAAETKEEIAELNAQYEQILVDSEYTGYSAISAAKEDDISTIPYVIPPEEFGEKEDYDCISLTYYDDGVLTDSYDELIEDVENVVGYDSLKHFGEYEDDSVHVRNDRLKNDYEILADPRKYSDVIKKKPHPVEE